MFSRLKCLFSVILTALSGGVFSILLTWRPDVKLNCLCEKVPIRDATKILLKVRTHYFTETDCQKIELRLLLTWTQNQREKNCMNKQFTFFNHQSNNRNGRGLYILQKWTQNCTVVSLSTNPAPFKNGASTSPIWKK